MSRIARKPTIIPKGVDVQLSGQNLKAKGPKGELEYNIHELVAVKQQDGELAFSINEIAAKLERDKKFVKAIIGTTAANIKNIIKGVSEGFERKLLLVGVGYRGQVQGKKLNLGLGFSHPVEVAIPAGLTIEMPTPTEIIIKGADKQLVGQTAANIRALRPVEPYKGKGVRYSDEQVILKETKK